jgi:hypothetical protein
MGNIFGVQVAESIGQLFHDVAALVLCEFLVGLLLHRVGKRYSRQVLHYDV